MKYLYYQRFHVSQIRRISSFFNPFIFRLKKKKKDRQLYNGNVIVYSIRRYHLYYSIIAQRHDIIQKYI